MCIRDRYYCIAFHFIQTFSLIINLFQYTLICHVCDYNFKWNVSCRLLFCTGAWWRKPRIPVMSYKCLLWSPVLSRICLSLWWNKNSLQLSAGFVGDGAYMHTYVSIYYYLKVCCNVPSFHKKYNIIHLWHGCDGNIKIYLPSDELIFIYSEPSCH